MLPSSSLRFRCMDFSPIQIVAFDVLKSLRPVASHLNSFKLKCSVFCTTNHCQYQRDLSISRRMTTWLCPQQCSSTFDISSQATLFKEWLINVTWWTIESQFHVNLFQTHEWKLVQFSKPFTDKENSGKQLKSTIGCSQICKSFTHFVECYPLTKVRLRSRWCKDGYCSNSIFN